MGFRNQQELGSQVQRVARAAVYARYSSEMQSSSSAQDQVNRIVYLVEREQVPTRVHASARIEILPEWILKDEAVTGKVAGRKGYQSILYGIREHAFDLLIVDDLSRLTRSLGNMLELYQLLKHFDVELISVSDRVSSADPNARTFFTVKGMVADFGNEAHSERTMRGLEARARDMFSTGQKPYGYGSEPTRIEKRKGKEVKSHYKLFVIHEQAEVVRRIFKLYADGYGKKHIAKVLNQEKAPTPQLVSTGWKDGIISKILANEKYAGEWIFNKVFWSIDPDTQKKVPKPKPRSDWIVNQREDLRIVDQDLWEVVQKKLEENREDRIQQTTKEKRIFSRNSRIDNRHLLSGVMICSECKTGMILVSGKGAGYYGCFRANRQGMCTNKTLVSRKIVEERLITELERQLLGDDEVINYSTDRYNQILKKRLKDAPSRKRDLEASLKKLNAEISNLIQFITEGKASDLALISQALREREGSRAKVTQELARIAQSDNKHVLVTPFLIRSRLAEKLKILGSRGDSYNEVMKSLFKGPLIVEKEKGDLVLKGLLNLGGILSSTQCAIASPTGFEPVPSP